MKLGDEVKQGYAREGQQNVDLHMDGNWSDRSAQRECLMSGVVLELLRKLNDLEQTIHDRHRQMNGASEQRREFDRIMSKLQESMKATEQQLKDPLSNDLQQSAAVLKEKCRTIQVNTRRGLSIPIVSFFLSLSRYCNPLKTERPTSTI